jgi:hypothetical protein
MESELRSILSAALDDDPRPEPNLAEAIRRRFQPIGGVEELPAHPRAGVGPPPAFER